MRTIKQIAIVDRNGKGAIIALCDDNTLWQKNPGDNNWYPIFGIPDESPNAVSMPKPGMIYEVNGQRYRPVSFTALRKGCLYLSGDGTGIYKATEDSGFRSPSRIIVERI